MQVLLAAEKARIPLDPAQVDLPTICRAVECAGYQVPAVVPPPTSLATGTFGRQILGLLAIVCAVILGAVVGGEWLGGW